MAKRAPIGGRAVGRHNKKPLAVARLELDVGRAPPPQRAECGNKVRG